MKNLKDLTAEQFLNEVKNLASIKSVTGGINGYPSPEIGIFLVPNSREDMEKLYSYCGKDIDMCHERDGWSMVELTGSNLDDYITINSDDFGDNYEIIEITKDDEIQSAAKEFFSWLEEDGIDTSKLVSELSNDLKVGINIIHNQVVVDSYDFKPISFSHDTHTNMLGFFIDNNEQFGYEVWQNYYEK